VISQDESHQAESFPRAWHAPLTHAPLGGLLLAAIFDVVSAIDGGTHTWARELYRTGTFVLTASAPLMALAVLSGLIDRSLATEKGSRVRSRTNLHGVVMAFVASGSALDVALRRTVYPDVSHSPAAVVIVTMAVFAVAIVGGDLGGRLTYRAGVNVARPHSNRRADAGASPVVPRHADAGS
jgi:uncharacterized membrane protein